MKGPNLSAIYAKLGTLYLTNAGGSVRIAHGPGFKFTYDGETYGFDAPADDHDRARELIGDGEVSEAAFVELNLMFDVTKSDTNSGSITVTDPAGVVRARLGVW